MTKAIAGRAVTFLAMMGVFAILTVIGYFGWKIFGYSYLGMDYLQYVYLTATQPNTLQKVQWILSGLWLIFGTELYYQAFVK